MDIVNSVHERKKINPKVLHLILDFSKILKTCIFFREPLEFDFYDVTFSVIFQMPFWNFPVHLFLHNTEILMNPEF